MTAVSRAVTVLTVIVLTALVLPWQIRRARAQESVRDRIIREANVRVGLTPPADDNWPGTNVADQDVCELIWDMPARQRRDPELDAGRDRLWDAIDEHRKENP